LKQSASKRREGYVSFLRTPIEDMGVIGAIFKIESFVGGLIPLEIAH